MGDNYLSKMIVRIILYIFIYKIISLGFSSVGF